MVYLHPKSETERAKIMTQLSAVYRNLISNIMTDILKGKEQKKMYHAIINQKLAGVTVLLLDKAGFIAKKITRDRDGYSIMTEGLTHEENTASCRHVCTKPQQT